MKRKVFSLVWIGMLLLSACTSNTPEATPQPAANTAPPTVEAAAPTTAPTPVPAEPTVAAVEDQCVTCHTDKQRLTDTAAIEEIAEEESEGVG